MIKNTQTSVETLEITCANREEAFRIQKALTDEMSWRYRWQVVFLGTVGNDFSRIIIKLTKMTVKDEMVHSDASAVIQYWQSYSNCNWNTEDDD